MPPDRALVLVPGLLCDAAIWSHQVSALSGLAEVQIAEPGESDSLGAMAERTLDTAPARFSIAGHSMGGRIALEVVRRAPDRVDRLALMDTGYEALAPGEVGDREMAGRLRLVAAAREHGMRAMGIAWVQGMVHPRRLSDRALIGTILDMIQRRTPDYYAAQTRALLERPDATGLLPTIACPTLVLCGQEDTWSPLDRHRRLAERIPGSRLCVVPDCGHMSPLEQPEAVSAALRQWLMSSR